MHTYTYVILGGGVVAGYAVKEFTGQDIKPHEVAIISADSMPPYERPPLSKEFLTGETDIDSIPINEASFYDQHKIDLHLNTNIERVDFESRILYATNGREFRFGKLLIATGSGVQTLNLPKAHLPGIFYLRSIDDARQIRKNAEKSQCAAVIGAGYIGMEVAAALTQQDIQPTIIFPEDRVMEHFFTPELSEFYQRYYEERGVQFKPQSKVTSFMGNGRVHGVTLNKDEHLPADMVVAGVGVSPNVNLFENTELKLDDGILVNEYLETSIPDVYAAGDIARYHDLLFDTYRRVEHWDNAVEQGQHVAHVMLGKREPFIKVPYFFSDAFDLSWEFWGDTTNASQVMYRGNMAKRSFSIWWMHDEQLIAAFVMNRPEERELVSDWIQNKEAVASKLLWDKQEPVSWKRVQTYR
ncbi:MAG: FAD-dependent oxidoreductase [Chloroflexota bacterium]